MGLIKNDDDAYIRTFPHRYASLSSTLRGKRKGKGKEKERKSIYIALFGHGGTTVGCTAQSAQAWITQFYLQITPCRPFLRERSPDVTTIATEAAEIQIAAHYSFIGPERMKG